MRLLDADPDLGALLTREEFAQARQLVVPVATLARSERDLGRLHEPEIFGALVLEGVVLRQLQIADQVGMQLHGPGDIVSLHEPSPPMLVVGSSREALAGTRLALLGREFLSAAQRWPLLIPAVGLRRAEQTDRLAAQLVICQLPRVEQRLLSMLWLMAETWGRVTASGTTLPLKLTHEGLGALIGARRPTVSLALRDLTDQGAIIRQSDGWLLLEPAPEPAKPTAQPRLTAVVRDATDGWSDPALEEAADAAANSATYARLKEAVERLRIAYAENSGRFDQRLGEYREVRQRCSASRKLIASQRLSRPRPRSPSS